jgi:hypothetical protein
MMMNKKERRKKRKREKREEDERKNKEKKKTKKEKNKNAPRFFSFVSILESFEDKSILNFFQPCAI